MEEQERGSACWPPASLRKQRRPEARNYKLPAGVNHLKASPEAALPETHVHALPTQARSPSHGVSTLHSFTLKREGFKTWSPRSQASWWRQHKARRCNGISPSQDVPSPPRQTVENTCKGVMRERTACNASIPGHPNVTSDHAQHAPARQRQRPAPGGPERVPGGSLVLAGEGSFHPIQVLEKESTSPR